MFVPDFLEFRNDRVSLFISNRARLFLYARVLFALRRFVFCCVPCTYCSNIFDSSLSLMSLSNANQEKLLFGEQERQPQVQTTTRNNSDALVNLSIAGPLHGENGREALLDPAIEMARRSILKLSFASGSPSSSTVHASAPCFISPSLPPLHE